MGESYNPNSVRLQTAFGIPNTAQCLAMGSQARHKKTSAAGKALVQVFGKYLDHLMEKEDEMTFKELEAASKVPATTIARTVSGESAIGIDKLPDLAAAFSMKSWQMLKAAEETFGDPEQSKWTPNLSRQQRTLHQFLDSVIGNIPDEQAKALITVISASVTKNLHAPSEAKDRAKAKT